MSLARYLSDKYGKKLLITATKTELDAAKAASQNVVHKTGEAIRELIGSKTVEEIVNLKPVSDVNSRNVEKIVIPLEKR